MWLSSPAIMMTMHSAFYNMVGSPARRMDNATHCYKSLNSFIANILPHPMKTLDWTYAPHGAWDHSAGGIRHALGDYNTGVFIPRDFGRADGTRHGRISALRVGVPVKHLIFGTGTEIYRPNVSVLLSLVSLN